ncbi:hypothetical protein M1V68_26355, partial [Klebsiella pneumoniae]|nr:hypothetical protein [Klebsiella pneumoniae]
WFARKRAYCLKTQPATGETYPKSDLFNKAINELKKGGKPSLAFNSLLMMSKFKRPDHTVAVSIKEI